MSEPTNTEVMWLVRRADGEDIGDYSHMVTSGPDDWSIVDDDLDEEATTYEMVRATLKVVETRTVAGRPEPCDEWHGEVEWGREWWSVYMRPDETGETWPLHTGQLTSFDTEREAWDWIDTLPEPSFVLPHFTGKAVLVDKQRLHVEAHGFSPRYGPCETCGHRRERHAFWPDESAGAW